MLREASNPLIWQVLGRAQHEHRLVSINFTFYPKNNPWCHAYLHVHVSWSETVTEDSSKRGNLSTTLRVKVLFVCRHYYQLWPPFVFTVVEEQNLNCFPQSFLFIQLTWKVKLGAFLRARSWFWRQTITRSSELRNTTTPTTTTTTKIWYLICLASRTFELGDSYLIWNGFNLTWLNPRWFINRHKICFF